MTSQSNSVTSTHFEKNGEKNGEHNGVSKKKLTKMAPPSLMKKIVASHHWYCLAVVSAMISAAQINPKYKAFYELQYRNPGTGLYTKGIEDLYFVTFSIFAIVFLRWLVQNTFLLAIARLFDIKNPKKLTKFKEAGYFFMWHSTIWIYSFIIILPENWLFDMTQHWAGYPHLWFRWQFKLIYLIQFAFWISCVFVLLIEDKRKDFIQMLLHHFVTIGLISVSYLMNYTRIGSAVLLNQDIADILLYLSKLLNYAKLQFMCTICFGVFALVWFVTRHGVFFAILYSIYNAAYEPIPHEWAPEKDYYFAMPVRNGFLIALSILQILLLFWFVLIFKVIKKSFAIGIQDIRSDSDEEIEKKIVPTQKEEKHEEKKAK